MFMVMLVVNDPDQVNDVLDAWEEAGVTGVTIMHSTGLGRIRMGHGMRDDFPLIPNLSSFMEHDESYSRTLFTVCRGEAMVDRLVAATQKVIGDLSKPSSGLLVVLPVVKALGLDKNNEEGESPSGE